MYIYTPMDIVRNVARLAPGLVRGGFHCLSVSYTAPFEQKVSEPGPLSSKEVKDGYGCLFEGVCYGGGGEPPTPACVHVSHAQR